MGVGTGWLGVWVHWGQLGQHGPQFRLQHGGLLGWPGLLLRDLSGVLKDHPQPLQLGGVKHPETCEGEGKGERGGGGHRGLVPLRPPLRGLCGTSPAPPAPSGRPPERPGCALQPITGCRRPRSDVRDHCIPEAPHPFHTPAPARGPRAAGQGRLRVTRPRPLAGGSGRS